LAIRVFCASCKVNYSCLTKAKWTYFRVGCSLPRQSELI